MHGLGVDSHDQGILPDRRFLPRFREPLDAGFDPERKTPTPDRLVEYEPQRAPAAKVLCALARATFMLRKPAGDLAPCHRGIEDGFGRMLIKFAP